MMIKYLTRKNTTFWYRRKINKFGEVLVSLKTKNYEQAIIRHSYIDYKIKNLLYKGLFEQMNVKDIRELIDKYKTYMIEEEYNDYEDQRDKDLTIEIDGEVYGGHTKEALGAAIEKYKKIHQSNNDELIKEEALKILKRTNLQDDFKKLENDKERNIFYWELVKGEWELLYKNYNEQMDTFGQYKPKDEDIKYDNEIYSKKQYEFLENIFSKSSHKEVANMIKGRNPYTNHTDLTILGLTSKYIKENKDAKGWSNKNERDILYVLGNMSSFYDDKQVNQLNREDFSNFRDEVLKYLPQTRTRKEFQGKSTKEVISMVKNNKYTTIGITTINKHLRRVHQVFQWGFDCNYVEKNLSKHLKIEQKKKSKEQKTAKVPYTQEELKKIFENTPWFNEDIVKTLRYNPEYIFIPLMALYTGAKPSELAQLIPNSFKTKNGILGIDFNMMIKNNDTERFTPLSKDLIDLGIMKFVKHQKKNKEKQLFPSVRLYSDNGTNFTNAFTIYNRKYISQEKDKTFYSFRHLINQMLKNKRIPTYIINDITGHSHTANKDEGTYGDGQMPEEVLQNVINECLVYDFIDFSKIKENIDLFYK